MKVLIAADNDSLDSRVAKRFGHANYYLIVDTATQDMDVLENSDHSHNHAIIKTIADKGVEICIVGNIGPHAFELINSLNIKVALSRKSTANEAIKNLLNNKLKLLSESTVKKSINKND